MLDDNDPKNIKIDSVHVHIVILGLYGLIILELKIFLMVTILFFPS